MPPAKPFRLKAPRVPPLREHHVAQACLDYLRVRGYYPVRLNSGLFKTPDGRWVRVGEPGLPDYMAIHPRYPGFFLEVKRPGGVLSADQTRKIQELRIYRLSVAVIDNVEALVSWLKTHEKGASAQA